MLFRSLFYVVVSERSEGSRNFFRSAAGNTGNYRNVFGNKMVPRKCILETYIGWGVEIARNVGRLDRNFPVLLGQRIEPLVDTYYLARFTPSVELQPYLPRIFPGHQELCTETLKIRSNPHKIIKFHCNNISYMINYCNIIMMAFFPTASQSYSNIFFPGPK